MMRRIDILSLIAAILLGACGSSGPAPAGPATAADAAAPAAVEQPERGSLDARSIGDIVGSPASVTSDGVVRVTWSRTDVAVTVDGMHLSPVAGLTSWAAFSAGRDATMLMSDTVVFQDEICPAMDAAFESGLEITALHNHFLYDEPKVYFMHVGGHGESLVLARGIRAVWDAVREVRRVRQTPAASLPGEPPVAGVLDAASISRIVGTEASVQDGVVKVTIGREAAMHGERVGGSMGLTTWAAFSGRDALAAVDGDFAMTWHEVQPVLRALRRSGIHVVALHNHMIGEEPPYYFVHFWGKGPAADLARGFRAGLDAQREAGLSPRP